MLNPSYSSPYCPLAPPQPFALACRYVGRSPGTSRSEIDGPRGKDEQERKRSKSKDVIDCVEWRQKEGFIVDSKGEQISFSG